MDKNLFSVAFYYGDKNRYVKKNNCVPIYSFTKDQLISGLINFIYSIHIPGLIGMDAYDIRHYVINSEKGMNLEISLNKDFTIDMDEMILHDFARRNVGCNLYFEVTEKVTLTTISKFTDKIYSILGKDTDVMISCRINNYVEKDRVNLMIFK